MYRILWNKETVGRDYETFDGACNGAYCIIDDCYGEILSFVDDGENRIYTVKQDFGMVDSYAIVKVLKYAY